MHLFGGQPKTRLCTLLQILVFAVFFAFSGKAIATTNCPNIGDMCDDGTVYAGPSPDGEEKMYTTPCDLGQTYDSDTDSCAGTATFFNWKDNNVNTGAVQTGITNVNTGYSNTMTLLGIDANSSIGGHQDHMAVKACADISFAGKHDWYLPARAELDRLFTNRVAIDHFDLAGIYWNSSEGNGTPSTLYASAKNFANGFTFGDGHAGGRKSASNLVRCVRKGTIACADNTEGVMIYNADQAVMQYCNGRDWIKTGARVNCSQASCGDSPDERVVFVTATGTDGNMGGVEGADAICMAKAAEAGLRGTYYAWLGDATTDPLDRFKKVDVPYVTPTGLVVAPSWDKLVDGSPHTNPININALGETMTGPVFSGVKQGGAAVSGDNCSNWTVSGIFDLGHTGIMTAIDTTWTNNNISQSCDTPGNIYCFEQGAPPDECTSPDGKAGEINYNSKHAVMQYCDGTHWINMGPKVTGASLADNVPTANLMGHWPLDEGEGTTAGDLGSEGNDGTLVGLDPATDWIEGKDGGALEFDGTAQYITLGNAPTLNLLNDFTISFWAKKAANNSIGTIFTRGNPGSSGYTVGLGAAPCPTTAIKASKFGIADICLSGLPANTAWNHYVITFTTTGVNAYVNGVAKGVSANIADINASAQDAFIGTSEDLNGFFTGQIDDVRIYNTVLGLPQIQALYLGTGAQGSAADCTGMGVVSYNDPVSGHCYYRTSSLYTWANAKLACEANGDYLAAITSDRENELLRDNVVQSNNSWFGASDEAVEGEWRWHGGEMDGRQFWSGGAGGSPVDDLYNDWHTNEPSNQGGTEHCAAFTSHVNYHWNDGPCSNTRQAICERSPPGDVAGRCNSPDGVAGEIVYNDTHNVMQYCNGDNWVRID